MIASVSSILRDPVRSKQFSYALILLVFSLFGLLLIIPHPLVHRFLGLVYLGSTLVVGVWLFYTRPTLYLGYVWWIWVVSPFVRRYIDFMIGGFTPGERAFALLAPIAVTSLMILNVIRYGKLLTTQAYRPLLFCMLGTVYGLVIGMALEGPVTTGIAFIEWFAPLLMAFHLTLHVHKYPRFKATLQLLFPAMVLVLGIYGTAQYFSPAPWDRIWMIGSGMSSIGQPKPMEVRAFGLLNAPGPYAMALMTGILVSLSLRSVIGKVAVLPALIGLALSMVRAAWGGLVVGIGTAFLRLRGTSRIQTLIAVTLTAVIAVTLVGESEIGSVTSERVKSMQNLSEDGSFQARKRMYQRVLMKVVISPLGHGIGSAHWDSGFVTILWQLGWLGGCVYLAGYFLMARSLLSIHSRDRFAVFAFGISITFLALMLMGSQHTGFNGMLHWTFLGMVVASNAYHKKLSNSEERGIAA
jgi:hypothetical protein